MAILHPTKTVQPLQPRYVSRFACTGSACEDNCCTGWTVHIDKKTFNAYRQTQHPGLAERLTQDVKRLRSKGSDREYASIQLRRDTAACPFLEDKLCGVQRDLGEDKLSNTCATYPRTIRQVGRRHEQALTLSCPEAARLALLDSDAMDFADDAKALVRGEAVTAVPAVKGLSHELMTELRFFALQLMKTEALPLWIRLATLGLFCHELTQRLQTGDLARIASLPRQFTAMIASGEAAQALEGLQPDHVAQSVAFAGLWRLKGGAGRSAAQQTVRDAVVNGLGADLATQTLSRDTLIARYRSGVARLPEAMKDVPWLLDHYVINEMFMEAFPFADSSPYEHFLKLVTRLGVVRFMLAAQCNAPDLPDGAQLVRTVQVFCRDYQHDVHFATVVNTALKNAGWDGLDRIYRFLKT